MSDVSFDIYEGETLGIIGESGCGKSTLGRCLVKLHKPSAGTITYNGKDLWNLPVYEREAARRDIQMIFQDPYSSLDPRKTASYSIEEAMKVHHIGDTARERRQKALEYLQEVGLDIQHMERYPHEFSGGMRQRVMIAMAMSSNPQILIADEPTTALDVTIQARILELINDMKREHDLSVIFITHDLGVVANIADRVCVMYAGRIVEVGTCEDIFYHPAHPYTWALLSAMPDLHTEETLYAIPGAPPNMLHPPKGDAFAARNKYAMKIDFEKEPPYFKISDTHYAATWLLHPDAPNVEMPEILQHRIARMKEEAEHG